MAYTLHKSQIALHARISLQFCKIYKLCLTLNILLQMHQHKLRSVNEDNILQGLKQQIKMMLLSAMFVTTRNNIYLYVHKMCNRNINKYIQSCWYLLKSRGLLFDGCVYRQNVNCTTASGILTRNLYNVHCLLNMILVRFKDFNCRHCWYIIADSVPGFRYLPVGLTWRQSVYHHVPCHSTAHLLLLEDR